MFKLDAKSQIALGQTGLLFSLLLVAILLNMIPDRLGAVREGRAIIAEVLASNSSAFITQSDLYRLKQNLSLIVKRNDEILSAAIRREDGKLVTTAGPHEKLWQEMTDDSSSAAQIQVPLWAGKREWGRIEIRFTELEPPGLMAILMEPRIKLILFISVLSFIMFYFYLGKMLKQLDPSQAIPERVRSALDALAEGLLVMDTDGNIVLANKAFASVVNSDPDDLIGDLASKFKWAGRDGQLFSPEALPWSQALASGRPEYDKMMRLIIREDFWLSFIVNSSPVHTPDGDVGGILVSFDDVTDLQEKEIQLTESRKAAEEANRSKSEFLANMSHEIRTPMNAIIGFAELLMRGHGKSQADNKKHLKTILNSSKQLLELINDILDLSKVESGQMEVEKISCEPHRIIQEVVKTLGVKAEEANITLDFEVRGELPATVSSDPPKLRQIITNLVGNAIKFTGKGGVIVEASFQNTPVNPLYIIKVIDTGIGMTADVAKSIFNPFSQADSSITRRFGGTGLGLSISLRFAKALGGDIEVKSEPGKGSQFIVSFHPGSLDGVKFINASEITQAAEDEDEGEEQSGLWSFQQAKVLVADDGPDNRELLKLVLGEVGLDVTTVSNGQEVIDAVQQQTFDVILMDVQMPEMDGFTATGILRQRGIVTPIYALTAHAMKGYREKCIDAGFTDYMSKPVDIDELFKVLAELLGAEFVQSTPDEIDEATGQGDETAGMDGALPGSTLKSLLVVDDGEDNRNLIKLVLGEAGVQVETANDGQQGVDIASKKSFDLILMDVEMPVMDGITATDLLRKRGLQTPVIAMTAHNEEGFRKRCLAAGFNDFLGKPVDVGSLLETLESIQRSVSSTEGKTAIVSRLAGHAALRPTIAKFVSRLHDKNREMEQAFENNNFDELADIAHWLKGSAGTVGFDDFTEPAGKLEIASLARNQDDAGAQLAIINDMVRRIVAPHDE
ncbi:MAG: response regulator [Gammaproteobacteria bacterium]|nr:response regulator [Gammaproteobacteria bacterium]